MINLKQKTRMNNINSKLISCLGTHDAFDYLIVSRSFCVVMEMLSDDCLSDPSTEFGDDLKNSDNYKLS